MSDVRDLGLSNETVRIIDYVANADEPVSHNLQSLFDSALEASSTLDTIQVLEDLTQAPVQDTPT